MAGPVIANGFLRRSEAGRRKGIIFLLRISTRHWQSSVTGNKSIDTGYYKYRVIKEWVTGPHALLEDAEIQHEIYTEMKK